MSKRHLKMFVAGLVGLIATTAVAESFEFYVRVADC